MELIFKSQFVKIFFSAEKSLICDVWSRETAQMEEDEFKQTLLTLLNLAFQKGAEVELSDSRNMLFPVTPDLQAWIVEHMNRPGSAAGFRKVAFLRPTEFIERLSIEQVVAEFQELETSGGYQSAYFDEYDQAEQWLLAK